ncbi:MAG: hypothetical protein OQK59_06870 [Chlorobium sp.]|nr:hypothetical protein [Chlorobium sp.]
MTTFFSRNVEGHKSGTSRMHANRDYDSAAAQDVVAFLARMFFVEYKAGVDKTKRPFQDETAF